MRKLATLAAIAALAGGAMLMTSPSTAQACTTIQDGTLLNSASELIEPGYDVWGYNYQARIFNGLYGNFSRPVVPITEDDTALQMKWSDAWLSNKDCSGDGELDRGWGTDTPDSSQGWLTNHMLGSYEDTELETQTWTYFVKIVYMPGCEPGQVIWNVFCIIEEVYNDTGTGEHGVDRDGLLNPAGLGFWTN